MKLKLSPEEEAKELVDKMYSKSKPDFNGMSYYEAKDCAIVAVDEILLTLSNIKDRDVRGNILLDLIKYWQEVKTEIEKL
jgi:hypothetical protein